MLTPDIYYSAAGEKAADGGYELYCECYYENLGTGQYSVSDAERQALLAGVYMALLNMQGNAEITEKLSNLSLWEAVEETDAKFTKQVSQRGGYTAIDPQYQAKMATGQFGPHGSGWGFESSEFDFTLVESTGMVIHKAVFFYLLDGKKGQFPIHNAVSIWSDKNRTRPDEDFAKKLETNTISKALSKLGFCADIFMGKFDDQEYRNDLANKQALENADNKIEEQARQEAEYQEWLDTHLNTISNAASMNELEKVFKLCVRKAKTRNDDVAMVKFTKAKDKRKGELSS
jgi:hypothetical protein